MKKIKRTIISFLLLCTAVQMQAQQKYAVLVGINKYYDQPGIQHTGSVLSGCVNDVLAMGSMLRERFGFSEDHITALVDDKATKKNVTDALNNILEKCKAGDAIVFYFSGHGVWMTNLDQDIHQYALKRGMNQAMVMSDLYADKLDCLFTDAQVKKIFNKFIDKKVVPTAIFDCCFSGMIPATYAVDEHNPYELDLPAHSMARSLPFMDIWEASEAFNFQPDTTGTKAFNLKDALTIRDSSVITRPFERTGSMFLSLAATDQYTEGWDIVDETGTAHGAYTSVLLHVIRDNPSNMSVAELIRKTDQQIKLQQYPEGMNFYDKARLSQNLIGIKPEGFKDHTTASCTANTGNKITLDAGLLGGLAVGNTLQSKNKTNFTVTAATPTGAEAVPAAANAAAIKPGDLLTVTNSFTKSTPLIKIFFSGSSISPAAFNKLMEQDILPLVKLRGYHDYENWDKGLSRNLFYYGEMEQGSRETAISLRIPTLADSFQVFLPIPSVITNELSAVLKKNQDIQVVKNEADAELILYLNYIKPAKGKKPHYVFTWANMHGADVNLTGMLSFYKGNVVVADPYITGPQLKTLAVKIQDLLVPRIRAHTSRYLNDWPEN